MGGYRVLLLLMALVAISGAIPLADYPIFKQTMAEMEEVQVRGSPAALEGDKLLPRGGMVDPVPNVDQDQAAALRVEEQAAAKEAEKAAQAASKPVAAVPVTATKAAVTPAAPAVVATQAPVAKNAPAGSAADKANLRASGAGATSGMVEGNEKGSDKSGAGATAEKSSGQGYHAVEMYGEATPSRRTGADRGSKGNGAAAPQNGSGDDTEEDVPVEDDDDSYTATASGPAAKAAATGATVPAAPTATATAVEGSAAATRKVYTSGDGATFYKGSATGTEGSAKEGSEGSASAGKHADADATAAGMGTAAVPAMPTAQQVQDEETPAQQAALEGRPITDQKQTPKVFSSKHEPGDKTPPVALLASGVDAPLHKMPTAAWSNTSLMGFTVSVVVVFGYMYLYFFKFCVHGKRGMDALPFVDTLRGCFGCEPVKMNDDDTERYY